MSERPPTGANGEDEGERATELLLTELRKSRSDLARLVEVVRRERLECIAVSARAVQAWEGREPRAWGTVRTWLANRGVEVVTIQEERL